MVICIESVGNVSGCCGLSERSMKRAVCQLTGQKNLGIHIKKSSRDSLNSHGNLVEFSSENLVETLIIIHHLIYCMCT